MYGGVREGGNNWADLVNNNVGGSQNSSHTPRPARVSGVPGVGGPRSMMAAQQGVNMGEPQGGAPSPQLSAALPVPTEGLMGDGQIDIDGRFGSGDIMGGSGRQGVGGASGRTTSPMPQASVLLRQQNGRGLSPSPMRNINGLEASWLQQRSGSPMQQHPVGAAGAVAPQSIGATRTMSGQPVGSLDAAAGGQFWQSPRTASPSASMFRQPGPEVYSRGRSNQRALSPSQPGLSGYGGANPNAGGLMRTMSPSAGTLLPQGGRAGIAWSPVPPSPPAPKRSISPQPTNIVTSGNPQSLRWDPQRFR